MSTFRAQQGKASLTAILAIVALISAVGFWMAWKLVSRRMETVVDSYGKARCGITPGRSLLWIWMATALTIFSRLRAPLLQIMRIGLGQNV